MICPRHYKAKLPVSATTAERECADRWCRVTGQKNCRAWLVVGNQYFNVGVDDLTLEEAGWHCWMLAKALLKIEAAGAARGRENSPGSAGRGS